MVLRRRALGLAAALAALSFGCAQGSDIDADGTAGGSSGRGGAAGTGGTQDGGNTGGTSAVGGSAGASAGGAAGTSTGGSSGTSGTGGTGDASVDGSGGTTSTGGAGGSGGAVSTGGTTSVGGSGGAVSSGGVGASSGTGGTDAGADVITNPCAGVTCNTPPANSCADASTLTIYNSTGTCDQGQCSYTSSPTTCPQGCSSGACVNNPCLGVTCSTPPASVCADATHLTVYDTPGSCSGGNCSYGNHSVYCGFGCSGGVCNGDPCTGVTCNTPPASYCADASTLTVYDAPGTCSGSGACSYTTHNAFCSFGCGSGACSGNPCAGVTCTTPPANYCVSASTVRSYAGSGTCSGGTCSYTYSDTSCPYGCANGVCLNCVNDVDCGSGKWCSGGSCVTCNSDQHCGAACSNCTTSSGVCSGGTTCVQCTIDSQCGAGRYCNGGTCANCDVAAHCGASCAACSGSTPSCVSGACNCTAGSCPSNQTCTGGACSVCKTDAACGATCTACSGGTPRCLDQGSSSSCVQCLTTADCTGGLVCGAAHTCIASCVPPSTACSSAGSQDGGCSNPYRISRTAAGGSSGFSVSNTYGLCGRSNNFNGSCDSSNGSDAEYRLFMLQGETAAVTLSRGSSTCTIGWSGTISLRIYQDTCSNCAACATPTCSTQPYCTTSNSQNPNFVAPADGWYTFVVDSKGPVEDKGGVFSLNIKLTCAGTCGC